MSFCKTYFNLLILGCLYKSTKKLLKCLSWVLTIPLILSRSILSMLTLQTKYVTLLTANVNIITLTLFSNKSSANHKFSPHCYLSSKLRLPANINGWLRLPV